MPATRARRTRPGRGIRCPFELEWRSSAVTRRDTSMSHSLQELVRFSELYRDSLERAFKTASEGEVIGLFLEEKIPRGMSLAETVAEIKRQGGIVYVPHPFDRMHAVPDYEYLLRIVDDVDAIEVYNPRVAIGSFNEEAQRFAAKYRIVAGAGSDSHVAAGLGSVRVRMPDFDGPQEFLAALTRVADGGTAIDPEVVAQLMVRTRPDARMQRLSPREREVLALMAEGWRTRRSPRDCSSRRARCTSTSAASSRNSTCRRRIAPTAASRPCSATWRTPTGAPDGHSGR